MFKHLRQLFSSNNAPSDSPPARFPLMNSGDMPDQSEARVQAETEEKDKAPDIFICREAIIGRDQRIAGYAFRHPQRVQSRLMTRSTVRRFYDDALLNNLAALQTGALVGGTRFGVIELSAPSLLHPALSQLPKHNLVLLLSQSEILEPEDHASCHTMLASMREQGVLLGLKWELHGNMPSWIPNPDLIYLPLREYFGEVDEAATHESIAPKLAQLTRELRAGEQTASDNSGPAPRLRLIAGELTTPTEFSLCYRAGFDFFQGTFVNHRDDWKPAKSSVDRLRVMQLLNGLRAHAENTELVQELKRDPALSYRLLRYCNSPAIGLQSRINTLDQALLALGHDKLYRWLSLLLFHMSDPGYREWVYTEQAMARAALMESLGKAAGRNDLNALFLTGLFSLLDQLFDEPLAALVGKIQLPSSSAAALIERSGPLAAFLTLVEACEADDHTMIATSAKLLGLSSTVVNQAVFSALSWTSQMAELAVD